jgi:alkylation response protein AidB-like acyl-CoA dehydrogenase
MDFALPSALADDVQGFRRFLDARLKPEIQAWHQVGKIPPDFFRAMGSGGWTGMRMEDDRLAYPSALREALVMEELAKISPGTAVAVLAQVDLGLMGLYLHGSPTLKDAYASDAVSGKALMCLGNTENKAGSDSAGIAMTAEETEAGWRLNGTKAYVTNGLISDLAVITAVTDPTAERTNRISMFLVNLSAAGVSRTKLNKQVWIPSDLTRLQFKDVFVPADHLLGRRGRGLQQVLSVFAHSRLPISALTLGTAVGAFELALDHARKREIFGQKLVQFQAKAFEIADFYAKLEAARLMLFKACWLRDTGKDFRQQSSLAKYLAVEIARSVTIWAADLFGAASVVREHPIHKFPMDAWASSLGEGTQDVQKLVIFRELIKQFG